MATVVSIVEGHGEVAAVPILLRRLTSWVDPSAFLNIGQPIRTKKDRFLRRDEEFSRHLQLASVKAGEDGWILILLDADDDCPVELARQVIAKASRILARGNFSVVVANREFEAWFLAAAGSLSGTRGFELAPGTTVDSESPRDAKGWLSARMGASGYGETSDQPAFCAEMDIDEAHRNSRSFRKLCSEWRRIVSHPQLA